MKRASVGGSLRHRRFLAGNLVAFGPEHIHDVVDIGSRLALSIHGYSLRLSP